MKAEQDEIGAIERRGDDIAAFIAEGRQRSDVLDQVARLAQHMAGQLSNLDASGQRFVVVVLDLAGCPRGSHGRGQPDSHYGQARGR